MRFNLLFGIFVWVFFIFGCSKEKSFKVTTNGAVETKARRLKLNGSAKVNFMSKISERGFCFSDTKIPGIEDNKTMDSTNGSGDMTVNIFHLQPNTTYNVVAYAKLSDGTIKFGQVMQVSTNGEYEVGDIGPAKGLVFNVQNSSTARYRFAEAKELSNSYAWGCENWDNTSLSYGTYYGTWRAEDNTNAIVNNCSQSSIAAKICFNLVSENFSDWLLPSGGDLALIYNLNGKSSISFTKDNYWSSSEYDGLQAYFMNLYDGVGRHSMRSTGYRIIAVRYFN